MEKARLEQRFGSILSRKRNTWALFLTETIVLQPVLTTSEKSPGYRIRERRFFLLFGLKRADCAVYRSCAVIILGRQLQSTNTAMLCVILPGQTVAQYFCGRGKQVRATWAICPVPTTVKHMT